YRDLIDVIFHDETNSTKSKALARICRAQAEAHADNSIAINNAISLCFLPYNIDEQAKSYFVHSYVLIQEGTAGYLSGVARLLVRPGLNSALEAAMVAVGSAGMACKESSPLLELKARQSYGIAINYINEAIHNTAKIKEAGTLAAILALGLYEMIMCDSQQSLNAWYNHMLGALAVAHIRGTQQFKDSEAGMELFLHLRSQIIISCIQRSEGIPDSIQRLTDEAHKYEPFRSLGPYQLGGVIMKLCSLRAWIRLNPDEEWQRAFAKCINLKEDIRNLYHPILRSQGPYTINFIEETTDEVYLKKYRTYRSLRSAWVWDLYHVAKIILHETIVDLLRPQIANISTMPTALATQTLTQYDESLCDLHEASSAIFASVPFYLNFHQKDENSAKPVNALILMWNLYAAARLEICAGPAREWAIQRLQFMGHSMGVRQATALATVLKKRAAWETIENKLNPECKSIKARRARRIGGTDTRLLRYLTDLPPEPLNRGPEILL
ncbi:hypothetical protein THAR02_02157, partial [Trichoderma harzianum]